MRNRILFPSGFITFTCILSLSGLAFPQTVPPSRNPVQTDLLPPTYMVPVSAPSSNSDPNAHLPSSSKAIKDISKGDGFDFDPSKGSTSSVRGNPGGSYVVESEFLPEGHIVRRGETLTDIATRYYRNPYAWPKIWGQNGHVHNPNWIYPGDWLRLRESFSSGKPFSTLASIGSSRKGKLVPPETIFLRDVGWIEDSTHEVWGEIVGSPNDNMFLSYGNSVYIQLNTQEPITVGQELSLFFPIPKSIPKQKGKLISIRGTVKIERYNPDTQMAKAMVTEELDTIERGTKVGPVKRAFDVIPPTISENDLEAKILTSIYPYTFYGQNMVVFLNRGKADGVKSGQRFFAVTKGDPWNAALSDAGELMLERPRIEDGTPIQTDTTELHLKEKKLPEETIGELRVLWVYEHTSVALVTASKKEMNPDTVLLSKKGL